MNIHLLRAVIYNFTFDLYYEFQGFYSSNLPFGLSNDGRT
jgi:hypothetical protein